MELTGDRALASLKRSCGVRLTPIPIRAQRHLQLDHDWKKRGWRTADKSPVKNVDLWQKLDELVQKHDVEWIWVRGHDGQSRQRTRRQLANRGAEALRAGVRGEGKRESQKRLNLFHPSSFRFLLAFPRPSPLSLTPSP